ARRSSIRILGRAAHPGIPLHAGKTKASSLMEPRASRSCCSAIQDSADELPLVLHRLPYEHASPCIAVALPHERGRLPLHGHYTVWARARGLSRGTTVMPTPLL